MPGYKKFSTQLRSLATLEAIIAAGGKVLVCTAGTTRKATIYSPSTQLAISNPLTPVRGKIEFLAAEDVSSVDLYIQAPGGQFRVALGVYFSGPNEIDINTDAREHTYVLPFAAQDSTAAVETDTGFDLPTNAVILPAVAIRVTAIDATETIDIGTATADSGDPDGFMALGSVATLGLVSGTTLTAPNVAQAGKSIVYTLSTGSDTAQGFITLPVRLAA